MLRLYILRLFLLTFLLSFLACSEDEEPNVEPEITLTKLEIDATGKSGVCSSDAYQFNHVFTYSSNVPLEDYHVVLDVEYVREGGSTGDFEASDFEAITENTIEYIACIGFTPEETYLDNTYRIKLYESLSADEPVAVSNALTAQTSEP